jgi:hypothetical protein
VRTRFQLGWTWITFVCDLSCSLIFIALKKHTHSNKLIKYF